MKRLWLLTFFAVSMNFFCVASADAESSARPPLSLAVSVHKPQEKLQLKEDEGTTSALAIRVLFSLLAAITLAIGALVLLRRFIPAFQSVTTGKDGKRVRLLEITRLTPKLTLYLVSMDADRYFFAQIGDNLVVLDRKSGHPQPVTSDTSDE